MPNILTIMGGEVKTMPDYKKIYLTMVQETENAINILIDAQRKCEPGLLSRQSRGEGQPLIGPRQTQQAKIPAVVQLPYLLPSSPKRSCIP